MKIFNTIAMLFVVTLMMAQEKPAKVEIVGDMVKATYTYENGQIRQQGFYKDGKLHGTWVSYAENGKKTALGQYENGKKTGKWFFWSEQVLSEVDYRDSRVAEVTKWSNQPLVNN